MGVPAGSIGSAYPLAVRRLVDALTEPPEPLRELRSPALRARAFVALSDRLEPHLRNPPHPLAEQKEKAPARCLGGGLLAALAAQSGGRPAAGHSAPRRLSSLSNARARQETCILRILPCHRIHWH